ncbi:uncharacterized protein LOC109802613 [Cajanus cajan]|nr:uncharacterized protein LOC109802613 [Cajanus cajan]
MAHKNKNEWLKDMRGMLSLVATVIATITFQSALNPPGGVRPASDDSDDVLCHNSSDTNPCPGESVLAVIYPDTYERYLFCNTLCFASSQAVCLLLVSGFPMNHRFFTWLLLIGMCITLSSLTLAYLYGAFMITPNPVWAETALGMFAAIILIWLGLLGLIALFLSFRLIV